MNTKTILFSDYLEITLPKNWIAEDNSDTLTLYNPDGNGAITISFLNILELKESMEEKVSEIAVGFVRQNDIKLHSHFILRKVDGKNV